MVRICLINSVEDPHEKVKNAPKMDDPFEDERRLPFSVVSCSGQDDDYPVTELTKGAAGHGWQSQRFCMYPQEVMIELQCPSHVLTMQLLCHEYKISSKIEIFASVLSSPPMSSRQMKRLGHLSLDPNERTGFQARELKSIQINSPASAIRLVLHTCYSNKLNVYNQVGIVALIVTGDTLSEEQIMRHQLRCTISSETPRPPISKPRNGTDFTNVDSITGQQIQKLQQEKKQAVEEEDYDEAKRLKMLIEKLRTLGQQIKGLEIKKKLAVEVEDYDEAKICKLEIQKLRQVDTESMEDETANPVRDSRDKVYSNLLNQGVLNHRESCDSSTQTSEVVSEDEYKEDIPTLAPQVSMDEELTSVPSKALENLPAFVPHEPVAVFTETNKSVQDGLTESPSSSGQDEVLSPEPVPELLLKEYSDVLTILDQYYLECLLSKHWQLRDKSLQTLEKELQSKSRPVDTLSSFRAIHKVLARGLNDRVSNVFFSSIQVLRAYVTKYAAEVSSRELHSCLADVTSILLEKLGDSNARTREAAADTLMYFAVVKEIGLNVVAPLMLKVPKTLSMWKPILGRLQWLMQAIPKFGLQPQGRGEYSGFATESLMHFVVHGFNYPNGEVRNAAMKVTTEVYKIMGLGVEKYLKGVKPMIREVIIGLFEKTGEDELSASSSNPRESRSFKLTDSNSPSQKGKNVMDAFERQSYPQPVSKNKYADRFDVVQSTTNRPGWMDASSSTDFNQVRMGKPSCSAARR